MEKYESRTECPPIGEYKSVSQLTAEAVAYWKESYKTDLTPQEWDSYAQQIEFYYRTDWVPDFKTRALKILKDFYIEIGKEFIEK